MLARLGRQPVGRPSQFRDSSHVGETSDDPAAFSESEYTADASNDASEIPGSGDSNAEQHDIPKSDKELDDTVSQTDKMRIDNWLKGMRMDDDSEDTDDELQVEAEVIMMFGSFRGKIIRLPPWIHLTDYNEDFPNNHKSRSSRSPDQTLESILDSEIDVLETISESELEAIPLPPEFLPPLPKSSGPEATSCVPMAHREGAPSDRAQVRFHPYPRATTFNHNVTQTAGSVHTTTLSIECGLTWDSSNDNVARAILRNYPAADSTPREYLAT